MTYQEFLNICQQAINKYVPISMEDFGETVTPMDYFDDGMNQNEAVNMADEFARDFLTEEGFDFDWINT